MHCKNHSFFFDNDRVFEKKKFNTSMLIQKWQFNDNLIYNVRFWLRQILSQNILLILKKKFHYAKSIQFIVFSNDWNVDGKKCF